MIEEIVGLAEDLTPIALIGAGGIGKTSIALAVLNHDRIKQRFGDNRRFIRCDQFLASRTHLLARLSKVIGAGVENPEDLTPLRPFLSSTDMILILDNAESILDPQGADTREIYRVVEELSRFSNICLGVTSRISTIPPRCKILTIPTLSIDAARDAFHYIYGNGKRTDLVDKILGQLDSHLLSLTLLATVAYHNKWDDDRLAKEWDAHRKRALWTDHSESLAAMIELSLASPMFRKLGSDARDLLSVVAFFPQGINENNLDWLLPTRTAFKWLFPSRHDRRKMLDKFCALSLTYRSNGFVMMLAPLRDYFRPKDPRSSPILSIIKGRYFRRLSVFVNPDVPGFNEAQWITSEDMNVEHLLDVFTTIDAGSRKVWAACAHFLQHLVWHKIRLVTLGPKIEGLPDDHPSKPECLLQLSRLFGMVGNGAEYKRLVTHTLKLWRQRGTICRSLARWSIYAVQTERLASMGKEYSRRENCWESTKGSMTYGDGHVLCNCSLGCCMTATSSTLQKKPRYERSIFSRENANDLWSANATVSVAVSVVPGAKQRRPLTTSNQPSRSHPVSTGMVSCFGVTTNWRTCFSRKASSAMPTRASNAPS